MRTIRLQDHRLVLSDDPKGTLGRVLSMLAHSSTAEQAELLLAAEGPGWSSPVAGLWRIHADEDFRFGGRHEPLGAHWLAEGREVWEASCDLPGSLGAVVLLGPELRELAQAAFRLVTSDPRGRPPAQKSTLQN